MSSLLAAQPPHEMSWVFVAYGLSVVVLGLYAVWTIRRGRRVGRQVPPEDRRWM